MILDDNNKKEMPEHPCVLAKSEHFAKLVLGVLDESVERDLEQHAIGDKCDQCLAIWMEISEIANNIKKPSEEEVRLIVRILTGKFWKSKEKYFLNQIIEEVDKFQGQQNERLDSIETKISHLRNNQDLINKKIKSASKYTVVAFSLVTLLSITLFSVITSDYYKNINVRTTKNDHYLSDETSKLDPELDPFYHIFNQKKKNTNNNLYDELDLSLDKHLESGESLDQAKFVAQKIQNIYNDNYGIDLVKYYRQANLLSKQKLLVLRRELKELENKPTTDNYEQKLVKVEKLSQEFLILGNVLEAYRAKILVIKFYALTINLSYKPIFSEAISYAEKNNYLFLKLNFLLWQAKSPTEENKERTLKEVISLSEKLEIEDTKISASVSLAGIYETENRPYETIDIAQRVLSWNPPKFVHTVTVLQLLGMGNFRLGKYQQAESYFERAIKIAEDNNSAFLVALTQSFLGTLASQKGDYRRAEDFFAQADKTISFINDSTSRADLNCRVTGYRAKSEFLQGHNEEAIKLYRKSIDIIRPFGIVKTPDMADLNTSLALALSNKNRAESSKYEAIAAYYLEQANAKHEKMSCLLSFVPNVCK